MEFDVKPKDVKQPAPARPAPIAPPKVAVAEPKPAAPAAYSSAALPAGGRPAAADKPATAGTPAPAAPKSAAAEPVLIDHSDFTKVQLRTARIVSAEKVAGATKLLKLEVVMGEERRQIVAGIALHYEPEKLVGKTVVVVANLKPAVIRGVESQGMLLAASKGETMKIITVDGDLSSGAVVK